MIFYALDAYYHDVAATYDFVNSVLADMCPFTFTDIGSADPAVYHKFCDYIGNEDITLDNSYKLANNYVKTIDYADVTDAFKMLSEEEWLVACKEYLASEHKGADE